MLREIQSVKSVTLFARAFQLNRSDFGRLAILDVAVSVVTGLLVVAFAPDTAALQAGTVSLGDGLAYGASLLGASAIGFLLLTIWVRFLATGELAPGVPVRFGPEEQWGLLAYLVVSFAPILAAGIVFGLVFAATMAVPLLAPISVLVLFGVFIALIYVALRLYPAVALSMIEARFAVHATWRAMGGHVGSLFLAVVLMMVAAIALYAVFGVLTLVVASLTGIDGLFAATAGGTVSVPALILSTVLSTVVFAPLRWMGFSLYVQPALVISGLDTDWTRALARLEDDGGPGS